ncbi:TetR/AcrR family transcriptional regulator [Corynebacterium sp. A21]|uniref:TetR/AcrR family transcriptional regulator n=1 Tax=Corynebacterium sp. A21 TaxID=3457318 RepID=UPI003FD5C1BD
MASGTSDKARETPDPARMLRLLWRRQLGEEEGARGPRKKFSLDQVIDAGIMLADREGLGNFSMRRVAEQLGISATSIYTYVPGRSELIGLMIDEVVDRAGVPAHEGDLNDRLRAIAELLWEEYHRHPWLLEGQRHRPWIGPGISARYEWELAAVEGSGLGDIAMDHLISLIETHTAANAAHDIQAVDLAAESGISDVDWWNIHGPLLEQVTPTHAFPISSRVGSTVGMEYQAITSHRAIFEFGLGVILAGVEKQLAADS